MVHFRYSRAASAAALLIPLAAWAVDSSELGAGTEAMPQAPPGAASTSAMLAPVTITARKFKEARIDLVPKVGTTVYTIDQGLVDSLGRGDATPIDDVLLRLPGVDQDSKASGSLHVRDDHGNVQYRINGVQVPENISGFGIAIDSRYVDQIDFITGALPAQYGLRTAGIVEIQTKEGREQPGGSVALLLGSHNTFQPSASFFGSAGGFSYYVSASYNQNDLGIENPQPTRNAEHDETKQTKTFANLSYYLNDQTRLGLILGTYNGKFQIPTNPDQQAAFSLNGVSDIAAGTNTYPSSAVNEKQDELNRFVAVSLQQDFGKLGYQLSAFHQYSDLHFHPDPVGDLVFLGVASDTLRSNDANGIQLDAAYKAFTEHTVRFGGAFTHQLTHSNNGVTVFPVDDSGAQSSDVPILINDDSSRTGDLSSLYAQDEWRIDPKFTLNYGLRFDHVAAFTNEHQWSPRINAAYKLTDATSLHAGFSRYFTPPPQELASQKSIDLYTGTTNAAQVTTSDDVKAERSSYYDIGLLQKVFANLSLSADAYYKDITDLIDEGQFGQALILSPFNYAKGYAQGLELSGTYSTAAWLGYLNLTYQKAKGTNIVSGQALFAPDELAYIAQHYIYLDHDQTYTASGGVAYKFADNRISGDFLYGSGLRRTPDGGAPNSAALPSYFVVNSAVTHLFGVSARSSVEARLAVLNLFDKTYLLRDGTGVGVGAPQYGLRRSLYAGLTATF
jgi:outer membrane receptor protein involved in Fe transport